MSCLSLPCVRLLFSRNKSTINVEPRNIKPRLVCPFLQPHQRPRLVASAIFYGLTVLQTYHYYRTYQHDSKGMKWFVGIMFVGDTVHLILCTWCIYWYLVARFGDYPNLGIPHWSMDLQTDANAVVGVGVQMFFARRVWQISRQKILTAVIVCLSAMHGSLGIYFTAQAFILKSFAKYKNFIWVTCVGLGSAAAADILIAVSLCYFLHKSRTGFARTDTLITTLMIYAINTGLVTSIFATFTVIFYAVMPNNFVWVSFFWSLGRLYINSFLATLNSREMLREAVLPIDGSIVQLSQIRSNGSKAYRYPSDQFPSSLNVTVETTKEQCADYIPSSKTGDVETQSPSSAKQFLGPNSPGVHAHLAFHQSPPSLAYQDDPLTPSYKC